MKKICAPLALAWSLGWIACTTISAHAEPQATEIEVVQSVPLETTLAVPGMRQTQDVWLEMIQGAQSTLDIEQFYVSDQAGEALQPVLEAIRAAANRGVRVRLIVDTKMSSTYPESIKQIGSWPNSESRLAAFPGGIQHAKFFIVDGKQLFVGSQNFDWRALSHIHEIGLRIVDTQSVSELSRVFERDWAASNVLARGPLASTARAQALTREASTGGVGLQLLSSPSQANPTGIVDSASGIVQLLKGAKRSIGVQVMEYSTASGQSGPWRVLDDALRAAAKRGVQVQLLVDVGHVKPAAGDLKSLAKVPGIEVRSVKIPAWSGGPIDYARLIHSKYVVVDGGLSGWVGTENWSEGYFTRSRDVGFVLTDSNASSQLARVFAQVWTSSYTAQVH